MTGARLVKLRINGVERELALAPNALLLDALREAAHLTGTKRGCDMGTCGCCTVLLDGENRLACLTLAAQAVDKEITTIEGLGSPTELHPIQAAFSDVGGSQCGFCTPGFIMTTKALLDRTPRPSRDQIREAVSGNLCRCTGYVKIFDAVEKAARGLAPEPEPARPVAPARRRTA